MSIVKIYDLLPEGYDLTFSKGNGCLNVALFRPPYLHKRILISEEMLREAYIPDEIVYIEIRDAITQIEKEAVKKNF